MGINGWDDELNFNTQFSSQWDSLCHFTHSPLASDPEDTGATYNGFRPTKKGLESPLTTSTNPLPTIDHWHARGCLVARGVLLDYKRYIEEKTGEKYHPLDGHRITVAELEAVAEKQGVEFKEGDVLLVRTGYTEMLEAPTPEDFAKFASQTLSGVHGAVETARWVWDHRFSAVAGDAHAFEALPPVGEDGAALPISELGELFLFNPIYISVLIVHVLFPSYRAHRFVRLDSVMLRNHFPIRFDDES